MARCALVAVVLLALGLGGTASAAPASSAPSSTLVITGHGWGHGIGMGQWGAYGYALHGWSYQQILLHYYTGTTIGDDPSQMVRVLLADGKRRVALASASTWQLVDGAGTKVALPTGRLVIPASLKIDGRRLVSPLTLTPGASPVEVGSRPYHGSLTVTSNGKTLQVVNTVDLESYVDGVVGAEMPFTWPAAALEAQAVAARSFALAQIDTVVTASPFDLYSDTRSQVYGGIDAESPTVLAAVSATRGKIVLYGGKVATTYYSASTGGETVAATDSAGRPIPYLVSVPDPYDTLSPYHDWGPVVVNADVAGKALGLNGPLLDLEPVDGAAGHVGSATAIGVGGSLTLSGAAVESDLGLRSTWFEFGLLSLAPPPPAAITAGRPLTLSGTAQGVSDVSLESRIAGGRWKVFGSVTPDATGAFSVQVTPQTTTWYRLASGPARAAPIEVSVGGSGPVVSARAGSDGITGAVGAQDAGAPVFLDRKDGGGWITVATATVSADGAFEFRPPFAPGAYRVRCTPGHGPAPGASSVISVHS
jgi:stage II sporulation protein D